MPTTCPAGVGQRRIDVATSTTAAAAWPAGAVLGPRSPMRRRCRRLAPFLEAPLSLPTSKFLARERLFADGSHRPGFALPLSRCGHGPAGGSQMPSFDSLFNAFVTILVTID